jgi:hypothetical protein
MKTTHNLIRSFIIVPLVATTLSMNAFTASINQAITPLVAQTEQEQMQQQEREAKAAKIDAYYAKYNLPLAGHGMQLVLAAEAHGLDWRLLPALAMRETTGGKFACKFNPFGFGSCKIGYKSFDEAIEAVAAHLGGDNESTDQYYAGKDTKGILKVYNSVIPGYTNQILSIMNKIDTVVVPATV